MFVNSFFNFYFNSFFNFYIDFFFNIIYFIKNIQIGDAKTMIRKKINLKQLEKDYRLLGLTKTIQKWRNKKGFKKFCSYTMYKIFNDNGIELKGHKGYSGRKKKYSISKK